LRVIDLDPTNIDKHGNNQTLSQVHAYILSYDNNRWEALQKVLANLGISASVVTPIALNSTLINFASKGICNNVHNKRCRRLSQGLSYYLLWQVVSQDPRLQDSSWNLFFEDDARLNPGFTYKDAQDVLQDTMAKAQNEGFFYGGLCCVRTTRAGPDSCTACRNHRAWGRCTHAYGLTKWRARSMYRELVELSKTHHTPRRLPLPGVESDFMDVYLAELFRQKDRKQGCQPGGSPLVAGLDYHSPDPFFFGHRGVFFQDRRTLKSQMGGLYSSWKGRAKLYKKLHFNWR